MTFLLSCKRLSQDMNPWQECCRGQPCIVLAWGRGGVQPHLLQSQSPESTTGIGISCSINPGDNLVATRQQWGRRKTQGGGTAAGVTLRVPAAVHRGRDSFPRGGRKGTEGPTHAPGQSEAHTGLGGRVAPQPRSSQRQDGSFLSQQRTPQLWPCCAAHSPRRGQAQIPTHLQGPPRLRGSLASPQQ